MKIPAIGVAFVVASLAVETCCLGRLGANGSATKETAISVPDLVGGSLDSAYKQLNEVDLEPKASDIYGDSGWGSDEDTIISTAPIAGTAVERYFTVSITYATAGEVAFYGNPMPSLKGLILAAVRDGVDSNDPRHPRSPSAPAGGIEVAQHPATP